MRSIGVLILFCFAVIFISPSPSIAGGTCDDFVDHPWHLLGTRKTCFMDTNIVDSADFQITSFQDQTVEGFNAYDNLEFEYLPQNLGAKFPNLLGLTAHKCSIKKITKANFKGLNKLRHLYLQRNQIEKIDDDTFDYVTALEIIHLDNNKIRKLNSRAFAALSKLTYVNLFGSECINEEFYGAARIAQLLRTVTSRCGYAEAPKLTCGESKQATGTVVLGENFKRGDFPWMVALYRRKKTQTEYFCGATVISDRHVLTAAHCLENLVASSITAVFGAYNLDSRSEGGRFAKSPSKIFVHDDWDPNTTQFDADIAMLLMPPIVFSTFVQPICLWESDDAVATSHGVIAGWGQSQDTSRFYEMIPTKLQLPIHTNENCFLKFSHLSQVSSKRTFCAGSADGRGPCHGDSGGGFYVSVDNVSFLRGIVSAAWDVNIYGECLLKMYTIYTDVPKFKAWIDNKIKGN